MGCKCKRINQLGEYLPSEKIEESIFDKIKRWSLKVIYSLIIVVFAVICVPVLIVVVAYKCIFKDKVDVSMPQFLIKYLERQ